MSGDQDGTDKIGPDNIGGADNTADGGEAGGSQSLGALPADVDVVVAGAGPVGAYAAYLLARQGIKVLVIEHRPRERAGRGIRAAVEEGIFKELGLPDFEAPVKVSSPAARELVSPDGKAKIRLKSAPLVAVDHRALTRKLIELAEDAGARFIFETKIEGPVMEDGRVIGMVGASADGRLLDIKAPVSVDATGISGALRHHLDPALGVTREMDPGDVAGAWYESRRVDREAVLDLLERNRIRPQVNVVRLGLVGPYSMLSIHVSLDEDMVEVRAGVANHPGNPSAREIVNGYNESRHWVGELISSGGVLVPARRPLDTFVAPGFAAAGDAACQAVPLHGGGLSAGLTGAKLLAETIAKCIRNAATDRRALWPYNARYMEARGAAQANSELFRRFVETLSTDEMSTLFGRGLINEEAVLASLEGLALEVPRSAVIRSLPQLWRKPGLLRRLWRLSKDSTRVIQIYNAYPAEYDEEAFGKWRARAAGLFKRWSGPA